MMTRRSIPALLFLLLTAGAAMPFFASGQAVRPDLAFEQPAPGVAVAAGAWLGSERPRVALHRPDPAPTDRSAVRAARIRDAVTDWELLLLGLGVPYTVIDDRRLEDGPDRNIDVLILPAASETELTQIDAAARFVRGGGGLIAAGSPAGDPAALASLGELIGARLESLAGSPSGAYQVLGRRSGLATGVPAGFRLNVAVRDGFMAARPTTGTSLGPIELYGSETGDAIEGLTAALRVSVGEGRIIWTGFVPQDVSEAPAQQLAWQRFAVAALASAAALPMLSVEAWPEGRPAVLALAVLPSPGYDPATLLQNASRLLDYLDEEDQPATFFMPGAELARFPELEERIRVAGPFGFTTRSEQPLYGQSADVQRARIREGASDVGGPTGGFLPPGMLFDGATLTALRAEGVPYFLRSADTSPSLMPDSVAVHDHVDFREADARAFVAAMPVGPESPESMQDAYVRTFDSGGLFVLPWRVEEVAPGGARYESLTELIARARREGAGIMSLGQVSEWTAARRRVHTRLQADGDGGLTVSVTNTGRSAVTGLVLRLDAGRRDGRQSSASSLQVSDARVDVRPDHSAGSLLLSLPELPGGSTFTFRVAGR